MMTRGMPVKSAVWLAPSALKEAEAGEKVKLADEGVTV